MSLQLVIRPLGVVCHTICKYCSIFSIVKGSNGVPGTYRCPCFACTPPLNVLETSKKICGLTTVYASAHQIEEVETGNFHVHKKWSFIFFGQSRAHQETNDPPSLTFSG